MAKQAATAEKDPVTPESEGLLTDESVFPDSQGAKGGLDEKTTVLVDEPEPTGPGTTREGGDGKVKTPEQLAEENKNLRAALRENRSQGKETKRSLLAENGAKATLASTVRAIAAA